MTSHIEYIADKDESQLAHLIEVASKRLDVLRNGKFVRVWVVADYADQGWFSNDDYSSAVAFLISIAEKRIKGRGKPELTLTESSYREHEAYNLISETKKELEKKAGDK